MTRYKRHSMNYVGDLSDQTRALYIRLGTMWTMCLRRGPIPGIADAPWKTVPYMITYERYAHWDAVRKDIRVPRPGVGTLHTVLTDFVAGTRPAAGTRR